MQLFKDNKTIIDTRIYMFVRQARVTSAKDLSVTIESKQLKRPQEVRNMIVITNLFDVFEILILSIDK